MLREFMMQGHHITPYPFKPFPASYVKKALNEGVGWSNDQMPSILGLADSDSPGLMAYEDYPYDTSKYPDKNPPIPGHPCKYDKSKVVPSYSKQITNMTSVRGRGASE